MISSRLWQIMGWTMLHYFWVGAALGAAAFLVRRRLRSAAANVRYTFAVGSLLLLSVAPAAIGVFVSQTVAPTSYGEPLMTAPAVGPGARQTEAARLPVVKGKARLAVVDAESSRPVVVEQDNQSWLAALDLAAIWLPWLWVCGTPLTFALTTVGLLGAERLRRQSRPLEDARISELCRQLAASLRISYRVSVAVCDRIAAPILVGILRPMILLPAVALAGWDPQQLEMVLLHELAHVRRYDNLVNLLQRIVESVLFFHPMVWIASSWVQYEREHCCDELVVARTQQPKAYAEILVALAERLSHNARRGSSLVHPQAVSSMAQRPLVARVRRILKKEEQSMQVSRRAFGMIVASLVGLTVLVGGYQCMPSRGDDSKAAATAASNTDKAALEKAFWSAVKERQESVRSFEWRWDEERQELPSSAYAADDEATFNAAKLVTYHRKWRVAADNEKCRMEEMGDVGPLPDDEGVVKRTEHSYTEAYNGALSKVFIPASGEAYPCGIVEISDRKPLLSFVATSELTLCYRFPEWLSYSKATKNGPLVVDADRLDGRQCVVVRWREGTGASILHEVWFDPTRNFIPVRQRDKMDRRGESKTIQHDIAYTQDDKHDFVPTGWTYSVWRASKLVEFWQAKVTHWSINPSVAAATFDVTFPAGTVVTDNDKNSQYIVRTDGSKRPVSKEEWDRGATYESLLHSEPPADGKKAAPADTNPKPAATKPDGESEKKPGESTPNDAAAPKAASNVDALALEKAFWHAVDERANSAHSFKWQLSVKCKSVPESLVTPAPPTADDKPVAYDRQWRVIVDGKKSRLEQWGDPYGDAIPVKDYSSTTVYDGQYTKTYSPKSGPKYPIGRLEKGFATPSDFLEHVDTHGVVLCYRLREWLSSRSATKSGPLVVKKEQRDGKDYLTVSYPAKPQDEWDLRVKVWFDPARNFIPVREENWQGSKTIVFDLTYTRDENYGFVPTAWTFSFWVEPKKLLDSHDVKTTGWAINPSLAADTFDLTFPPGTYVFDRESKTDYILRADGSKRVVTQQEWSKGATYESLLNSEPPGDTDGKKAPPADTNPKPTAAKPGGESGNKAGKSTPNEAASKAASNDDKAALEKAFWSAVKERQESVRSFEWRWDEERQELPPSAYAPADDGAAFDAAKLVTYHRKFWVVADREKIRTEETGDVEPEPEIKQTEFSYTEAYNGTLSKIFSPGSGDAYAMGSIATVEKAKKGAAALFFFRFVATRELVLCYRLPEWLSCMEATKNGPLVVDADRLDGKECLVVRWQSGSLQWEVWFDPARTFVPIRQRERQLPRRRDEQPNRTWQIDIAYARDDKHDFVPTSWTYTVLSGSKLEELRQARVTRWSINPSLAASTFDVVFPAGTVVTDNDKNSQYIVRADGSRRPVSKEEWDAGATYESLLHSEPPGDTDGKKAEPADANPKPAAPKPDGQSGKKSGESMGGVRIETQRGGKLV